MHKLRELLIPSKEVLTTRILTRIQELEEKRAQRRAVFFRLLFIVAVGLFAAALYRASTELATTGFFRYVSLIFSDGRMVLASWHEYLLSLIEAIPFISVLSITSSLLIVGVALRMLSRKNKIHFTRLTFQQI